MIDDLTFEKLREEAEQADRAEYEEEAERDNEK